MTELLDNTISDILQSNSAVEYVEPRENPVALREKSDSVTQGAKDSTGLELVFGQTHNGIECALCPTAKRACDRAWFSAKQIEIWSGMSKMTLNRRLNKLEEVGRINDVSDLIHREMPISNGGYQSVTLYNLNVLNQLAMVELDCDALNETAKKFSDILSEVETTGSYSIQKPADSYMIEDPIERAKRWIEEQAEKKRLEAERNAAIEAENRAIEASDQSFKARATAMGRLSNIRFRENDVKASERMAANGHPSKNKKFTVQNVMEAAWFQMLFKASQSERFYNGNPAWKPIIKSLKRLLSLKANNVVRHELENRFHEELSSTKAKKVFNLWMKAKEGGTPFHESLAEIDLGDMAVSLGGYIDEMVCLSERYSYTRSNGDTAYGIVYGYAYDIWARVLSSLYFREIEDYLRDTVEPDDFENTLYSVRSECYGLI